MKKSLLLGIIIAMSQTAEAQLFVKNNAYVYSNNQVIFVTSDVELEGGGTEGNMYLRNGSQLLQGDAGLAGRNKGAGKLSVFQEGTSNNFQYNNWCSPVGIAAAGAGNNSFNLTNGLMQPTTKTSSRAVEMLPWGTYDGTATGGSSGTTQVASRWIWKFGPVNGNGGNEYADWTHVGEWNTLNPGEGFTMKGTSGTDATVADASDAKQNNAGSNQRYDFRGKPNDGDISIPVSFVAGGTATGPIYASETLTGNPYPSSINLNMFLIENSGRVYNPSTGVVSGGGLVNVIQPQAYFWEHRKTNNTHYLSGYVAGYGTYAADLVNVNTPGVYTSATWNMYNADGSINLTGASSGTAYQRMFTPIGQGFNVRGTANGNAIMKNKYRVYNQEGVNGSVFEKSANNSNKGNETESQVSNDKWPEILNVAGTDYTQFSRKQRPHFKLENTLNNLAVKETAMIFYPIEVKENNESVGVSAPDGSNDLDVFISLDNNDRYVMASQKFDADKRIPYGFINSAQASYKVRVAERVNFDMSQEVYMHDKVTDVYYDMINGAFEITLPAGEYRNRFEVTFKDFNKVLANNNNLVADSFEVFQNQTNSMLTIVNTSKKDVASCTIFDVAGKLVYTKLNLGKNDLIEIPTSSISEGVYIVKVTTKDNSSIDKKVIISKK